MGNNGRLLVTAVAVLSLMSPRLYALGDIEVDNSRCVFVNKGKIESSAEIKLNCPNLPAEAIKNLEDLIQDHLTSLTSNLKEQTKSLKKVNNFNDYLSDELTKLEEQIAEIQQERDKALAENKDDQQNNPNNLLLAEERQALEKFELKRAAELREEYYQALKKEKQSKILELKTEMAREAFVSAERWENAFESAKALQLYQEAVTFKLDYPSAWRKITSIAKRLGKTQLALKATQTLKNQLNPESDPKWFSIAVGDEADLLVLLGKNIEALDLYNKLQTHISKLIEAEPENTEWQRDLSVSHTTKSEICTKPTVTAYRPLRPIWNRWRFARHWRNSTPSTPNGSATSP